jgi:hypothetical protein
MTSARFEPFSEYIASHRHFYVASSDDPTADWVNTYLSSKMAARITPLGVVGRFAIHRVDLPDGERAR